MRPLSTLGPHSPELHVLHLHTDLHQDLDPILYLHLDLHQDLDLLPLLERVTGTRTYEESVSATAGRGAASWSPCTRAGRHGYLASKPATAPGGSTSGGTPPLWKRMPGMAAAPSAAVAEVTIRGSGGSDRGSR